jgi:head-tail adaptor
MSGTLIFKGEVYQKGISQFTVRYRHDKEILPSMKIRYKSDLYDIIDVDNVNEANEFIKLMGQVITNGS